MNSENIEESSQNRAKANSFRAQIRSQLIKGLFHDDYEEIKSPATPRDSSSIEKQDTDQLFKKPHAKSKCFEEVYELEKSIGQGMHAIVKKATNKLTNQTVAVKIIRSGDPEIIRSVMREFQNVSLLEHPSIIKPYDLYINKITEHIHYVMEYVKYKSLSQILAKSLIISEKNVIKLLHSLLLTVDYMHTKGICHRDITAKNILISPDFSEIKLIDFGVSKQFAHYSFKQGVHLKKSMRMFTFTGVYQYMAPEILKGEGYNCSVDLWSIGVLTYELLCGSTPYQSAFLSDTIDTILAGNLSFSDTNISNLSKDFIKRLLKPDAKYRLTAKQALIHPWLIDSIAKKTPEMHEFALFSNKKKPSILTISALRNRIPSIDDIDVDPHNKKPGYSKFKEKFKEKMSIQGLDLHVHTIENQRISRNFRLFSPGFKGKSVQLEDNNEGFHLDKRKLKAFNTGTNFEEAEKN